MLLGSHRISRSLPYASALAILAACSGGGSGASVSPPTSPTTTPAPTGTPWNPTIQEFALPAGRGPADITTGADGNLWFTEPQVGQIGRMTTAGVLIAEYVVPSTSQNLRGMALGPDGNVWFADQFANFIAKISTTGVISEITLPSNTLPLDVTAGPDGNIWFSSNGGVGKLVPTSSIPTIYALQLTARPASITTGPDGGLWFTEPQGQRVGRVNIDGSGLKEIPLPTATAQPQGLTTGPDGAIWVAEIGTPTIGHISQVSRVTSAGQVTDFQTLSQPAGPNYLIAGPDKYIYLSEGQAGNIARIHPITGQMEEIMVPSGSTSGPGPLTIGPDGNLWFTELNGSKIARLLLP